MPIQLDCSLRRCSSQSRAGACLPRLLSIGVKVHYELRISFHFMHYASSNIFLLMFTLMTSHTSVLNSLLQWSSCSVSAKWALGLSCKDLRVLSIYFYDHESTSSCFAKPMWGVSCWINSTVSQVAEFPSHNCLDKLKHTAILSNEQ